MKKSRFGILLFSSISCSSSYVAHAWLTPLELDILLKPTKIESHYGIVPDTQFLAYPLFGTTKGAEGGGDNQPPPDREEFEPPNPEHHQEHEALVSLNFYNVQSSLAGLSVTPSRSDEITSSQLQQRYPHLYDMMNDIYQFNPSLYGAFDPSRQVDGEPLFILHHRVLRTLDAEIHTLKKTNKLDFRVCMT